MNLKDIRMNTGVRFIFDDDIGKDFAVVPVYRMMRNSEGNITRFFREETGQNILFNYGDEDSCELPTH